jgi:hypothetical protein
MMSPELSVRSWHFVARIAKPLNNVISFAESCENPLPPPAPPRKPGKAEASESVPAITNDKFSMPNSQFPHDHLSH